MTNTAQPCSKGLDADCFKAQPTWAKQAFAYRLLMTLCPRVLAKRLHRALFRFIIPAGVEIPPGIELPPGTIVTPGTVFPPGWTPEEPPPPGVEPPPQPPPVAAPIGPPHVLPGPGPGSGGGSYSTPTAPGYFFYETCDAFPGTFWTEASVGDGDVSAVAGRFKFIVTWGNASCNGTVAEAWPTNYDIFFTINSIACDATFVLQIYTGTHRIRFLFNCPDDKLKFNTSGGVVDVEVYDIEGKTLTYKLRLTSGKADIWRDSTKIANDLTPEASALTPGKISLSAANQGEYYLDDIFVVSRD